MNYHIFPSTLNGHLTVPGSKSQTMRAILFAALAAGQSTVRNILPSPDTEAMVAACTALGARIRQSGLILTIDGLGGSASPRLFAAQQVLDVGNSGQVLRFVAAIASLLPQYTVLTGDHSICTLRPMQPLLDGLTQLGGFAVSSKGDGHAPIIVRGPVHAADITVDGQDSQPVSALLMLAAFLRGTTHIRVENPGETPWIGLTLDWLDRLGVPHTHEAFCHYTVTGPHSYAGFDYTVPADWSSAAFPLVAALVTRSPLTLEHMDMHDPQGDKAIVDALRRMGANIAVDPVRHTVQVFAQQQLHGADLDVNAFIDAVPALAAVACFADSPTTLRGAAIARHKESDRLSATAQELRKMGARIDVHDDGLCIHPAPLYPATVCSHHDHRIAMATAVAALGACPVGDASETGMSVVEDAACVSKSFPGFAATMHLAGAAIHEHY